MAIEDRRARDRAARRRLIVTTARKLAEAQGWDAVTTRRLSDEIEYSQPVLYKHFSSMDDIAAAVAIDGFDELAVALAHARSGAATPEQALRRVAHAYIDSRQRGGLRGSGWIADGINGVCRQIGDRADISSVTNTEHAFLGGRQTEFPVPKADCEAVPACVIRMGKGAAKALDFEDRPPDSVLQGKRILA